MTRVFIPANAEDFIKLMSDIIAKENGLTPNKTLTAAGLTELTGYHNVAEGSNNK